MSPKDQGQSIQFFFLNFIVSECASSVLVLCLDPVALRWNLKHKLVSLYKMSNRHCLKHGANDFRFPGARLKGTHVSRIRCDNFLFTQRCREPAMRAALFPSMKRLRLLTFGNFEFFLWFIYNTVATSPVVLR